MSETREASEGLKYIYSLQYCDAVEAGHTSQADFWLATLAEIGVTEVDCAAIRAKQAEPTPAQRIALHLAPEKGWEVVITERKRRVWMSVEQRWVFEYRLDEAGDPAPLPDWEGDLNAAWSLMMELPDEYTPRIVRILTPVDGVMEMWTKASILHNTTHEEIAALNRDECSAICEAWLTWKGSEVSGASEANAGMERLRTDGKQ